MPTSWLACSTNGSSVAKRGVDLFPAPVRAPAAWDCIHTWKAAPRLGVEQGQDVVERHRRFDLAVGELAAVGQERRRPALGDQLHVGLPQQRLLAQDRVHVRADRRVLAGDFERRVGAAVVADLQRDHMADIDAR